MQSTGPFGLVVHCRVRSVTADLEYCYGCQFRDNTTMPLLLHTHPGNVASFWPPWRTKAATFWQRCQPLATLPLPGAFRRIGLGSDSYPAAPTRSEPTCTSCSTRSRPSAHCQLLAAFCPLPTALAAGCTRSSQATPPAPPFARGGKGGSPPHGSRSCFKTGTGPLALSGLSPFRNSFSALAGTGTERIAGEDVELVWLRHLPTLAALAWGRGSWDILDCF